MLEMLSNRTSVHCEERACDVVHVYEREAKTNEDMWLSQKLYEKYGVSMSQKEMARFAVETLMPEGGEVPVFMHKAWAYLAGDMTEELLAMSLEYYRECSGGEHRSRS